MKAIRVHEFGGPEVLRVEEVPTPQPGPVKCWFECARDPLSLPPSLKLRRVEKVLA
jgi:hypothetical protein